MDIIAAHQQGLIEQLDAEVEALAGHPRDYGQRAMVLHHLYEHSKGGHVWALAEARENLRIASGIGKLKRRLARWSWTVREGDRARAALEVLTGVLGEVSRERTIAAYRAYRLSATKALRTKADEHLPPELLIALDRCHVARREEEKLSVEITLTLAGESERFAKAPAAGGSFDAAWAEVEATGLARAARRLLGEHSLARCRARDERKGWARVERMLRNDASLPASFRINPAQHFYALQLSLAQRRRKQWGELCDLEPDAVALAA
jgi:hypothetical protein